MSYPLLTHLMSIIRINKNQTYFKKIGVVSWDNLDYDGIESVVGDIGTDVKVRGMNVGEYIAFETEAGKKGILKITDYCYRFQPIQRNNHHLRCKSSKIITFQGKFKKGIHWFPFFIAYNSFNRSASCFTKMKSKMVNAQSDDPP